MSIFLKCGCGANVQSSFHVACECIPSQAKSETVKQIRAICNVEVSSDLLPDDFSKQFFKSACGTS